MSTLTGEARVEDGIARAVEHAEHVHAGWSDEALGYLRAYVTAHPEPFLLEHVRQWAERGGLEPPPDARAWGGVIRAAQREQMVTTTGEFRVDRWGSPKSVWVAVAS